MSEKVIWRPKYVRYNSDADEQEIISEMKRSSLNIKPCFMVDVDDPLKVTCKYFDGKKLVTCPESKLSLSDLSTRQRIRAVAHWQVEKAAIQNSNESVEMKERLCVCLECRETGYPSTYPSADREAKQDLDENKMPKPEALARLKAKIRELKPNMKRRAGID